MNDSDCNASSSPGAIKHRRLFRCAAVLLALLPFVVAEIYLRMTYHVDSADLSVDPIFDTADRAPLFVTSLDGKQRTIAEDRLNFFRPASFPVEKGAATRRIFVLGGSTVQGRPYETETAFAQWASLRLSAADGKHEYEVINCGGVSYASYRVAMVLEEVLNYQCDAVVLYTGHNEFLENRSYPSTRSGDSKLKQLANRSRLVQVIRKTLVGVSATGASVAKPALPGELRTRLDYQRGMELYVRDPAWRRGVVDHFKDSVERMILMCQLHQVPLVVCMPTSDLVNTPPFKTAETTMDSEKADLFCTQFAIANDNQHLPQVRIDSAINCLGVDPGHAGVHYLLGRLYYDRNEIAKAKQHLLAARDHDVCPLRAITAIENVIEELATQYHVPLVRCDQLFDRTDSQLRPLPDSIPDPQRFVDHIHPSISGHQEIGKAVAEVLAKLFQVTPEPTAEAKYQAAVAEHLGALDESYFARGKQRLAGLLSWAAGRAGKYHLSQPDARRSD